MSAYQTIELTLKEGVAEIMLNRPKALNALNKFVFQDLNACFEVLDAEKDLVGVIIYGAGEKAFAAGADITEFMEMDVAAGTALSQIGHNLFSVIENFRKPVIAVVHGYALGGGFELALACHMRIAEDRAKFGLPEVGLGLIPGYGGTQRLKALCGKAKAIELTVTGDMIGAEEAAKLFVVNHHVPAGEGLTKARTILKTVSKKGPTAITKALQAIQSDSFQKEVELFGELIGSEESKEGASAFLEKRKANFK